MVILTTSYWIFNFLFLFLFFVISTIPALFSDLNRIRMVGYFSPLKAIFTAIITSFFLYRDHADPFVI